MQDLRAPSSWLGTSMYKSGLTDPEEIHPHFRAFNQKAIRKMFATWGKTLRGDDHEKVAAHMLHSTRIRDAYYYVDVRCYLWLTLKFTMMTILSYRNLHTIHILLSNWLSNIYGLHLWWMTLSFRSGSKCRENGTLRLSRHWPQLQTKILNQKTTMSWQRKTHYCSLTFPQMRHHLCLKMNMSHTSMNVKMVSLFSHNMTNM